MCAVVLLAACGGGGDSPAPQLSSPNPPASNPGTPPAQDPPPGAVPPPVNTAPYVIEYYGDSTIWGWATGTAGARVATPAPTAFANALPTPPQNTVRNEGVSGTTACSLLEGSDGVHPEWTVQMQGSDATHVIINHGINDQKNYGLQRYRECLRNLSAIARASGKQVVFETPNPVANEAVADYVAAMRAVAAEQQPVVPVIDQHAFLTGQLNGRDLGHFVPDGEHPTQEAYILKGEYAAEVFMSLFPR